MGKKTPLYSQHIKSNAKIVDFAGWDMPLHYGSQLKEHHAVRRQVGMFDVSHMGIVDLRGISVGPFLRFLLANNIDRLCDEKALYTCMLNQQGGVIDDLIVYKIANNYFRLIINAGTRTKDIDWIKKHAASYSIEIRERSDLAMLAVQGPQSQEKLEIIFPETKDAIAQLKPFYFKIFHHDELGELFIARTGYTGEDGFELILSNDRIPILWDKLLHHNVLPCGLGARDTLRLEAGLNLYGSDMDENTSPLEANLTWTVAMEPTDRLFIGRDALERSLIAGIKHKLVGLVLKGPGVMRNHQKIFLSEMNGETGEITSGGFSPTLNASIALARVPLDIGHTCFVEIRNKRIPAQVVTPPFVRKGKKRF